MLRAVRCVARISSHPAFLAAIASLAFLPAGRAGGAQRDPGGKRRARGPTDDRSSRPARRPRRPRSTGSSATPAACRRAVLQHRCPQRPVLRRSDGRARGDQQGRSGLLRALCYLATSSTATPLETLTLPVAVRPNNATLSLRVPSNGFRGVSVPVTIAGTTELDRNVYATAKPVGACPCGRSRAADPASNAFAFFEPGAGAFSIPRLAGPFATWSLRTLRLAAGRQG